MPAPPSILVVDDHPGLREILKFQLEGLGLLVQLACDGAEGARLFDSAAFELVITDYRMPRADGLVLIDHIRSSVRPVPVILCTGESDRRDLEERSGVSALFEKPLDYAALLSAVRRLLASGDAA